ncbi:MAG TPA: hypothetical protein PK239_00250 [Chitinophagales bacterium]|nr:hypothetical protein [Chitinophagales bacterium]HRK25692.1 hypothetical protein [Chitinophagales bacterium]
MGEEKSNIGATATIIVAIVGLLTAIVNIVPKLLESVPKEKTVNTTQLNQDAGGQVNPPPAIPPQGNNGTAQQQGGGFMPTNATDAEKEALKKKQADLERQMQEMKAELEAQKKRGNAQPKTKSSSSAGNDDVYYSPPKLSGAWKVSNYPGMVYYFDQDGSDISFTMTFNGVSTGGGDGIMNGNYIQFEAADMQSTYTGSFQISPDGRSMSGVAYNAYGTYIPIALYR